MKTFLKRRLAVLLVICMMCSMLPVDVWATEEDGTQADVIETVESTVEESATAAQDEPETLCDDVQIRNEGVPEADSSNEADDSDYEAYDSDDSNSSYDEPENGSEEEQSGLLASGMCGDNLAWVLTEDGTLTISGTGDMTDYWEPVWSAYQSVITSVVIEDGVTSIGAFAFRNCQGLTSVEMPSGLTSIGDYAFDACGSLTDIELPAGVNSIGRGAFSCCGLTSIELPDGLISVGNLAFQCCSLTSIEIPAGVASIGAGVFSGCGCLNSIDVDPENAYFCNDEFGVLYNRDKTVLIEAPGTIEQYTIPSTVTAIMGWAFCNCFNLTSIELPAEVTSIGDSAFAFCASLTGIELPAEVTSIGDSEFAFCASLTGIELPEGVTSIGYNTFGFCSSLVCITIPGSVTSVGVDAFNGCEALTDVFYDGTLAQWDTVEIFDGNECLTTATIHFEDEIVDSDSCGDDLTWVVEDGVLTISGTGDMYDYQSAIAVPWIQYGVSFTSLVIEDGVTSIGSHAFYGLEKLTDVTIADSVKTIGTYAFTQCTGLASIEIPTGVEKIGDSAFEKCTELISVEIPASVTSIDSFAFRNCSSLTAVTIPEGVTTIDYAAFMGCSSLNAIAIPEGVTTIVYRAFSDCTGLTRVTLPASVSSIGVCSFAACAALKDVYYGGSEAEWSDIEILAGNEYLTSATIHYENEPVTSGTCGDNLTWAAEDGVLVISGTGDMYDYGLPHEVPWIECGASFTSLVIEDGVTSIGSSAFSELEKLTDVTIAGSVKTIGECAFVNCTGLTSIELPEGVASIKGYAFSECSSLTQITIPDSVTTIGELAFRNCSSLTAVTIPEGVTTIDYAAFMGCSGLNTITIPEGVTTIVYRAFSDCTGLTSVTLPASVSSIGACSFAACAALKDVYYGGSKADWSDIEIFAGNDYLTSAAIHYANENEIVDSGTCGDNLTWILTGDGTLTISGTGDMTDWKGYSAAPWYKYQSSVGDIVIEDGVTSIGTFSFAYFTKVSDISIADSVTAIGDCAFTGCRGLSDVVVPNGVTEIVYGTFDSCTELTSVTIPDSVVSIGEGAFSDCRSLKEIELPDGVTTIERNAFQNCSALTSVTLPTQLTSIGTYAFASCSNLRDVLIQGELDTIAAWSFTQCTSLERVTIPSSVGEIGVYAFNGCNALTDVYYDGTEATWEGMTISEGNTCLTSAMIHYANENEVVDSGTCGDNLTWIVENEVLTISGTGDMYDYDWPSHDVPWVECGASVTSLVVEDGVTSIGSGAFHGLEKLTDVTIADSVKIIGEWAFFNCTGLTSIELPESVTDIAYAAFMSCTSLSSVAVPEGVTSIGKFAFSECEGLENVTISDSVTSIGTYAFQNCRSLHNISISESVTCISYGMFEGCSSLTSVEIPAGVTSIWNQAFLGCSSLTRIEVNSENSYFCSDEVGVLYNKEKTVLLKASVAIEQYTIPSTVSTISEYAFLGCCRLTSITLPEGVTSIGKLAFEGCSSLTSITIPEGVTSIGEETFAGCSGLTSITLPEGITSIGERVFKGCSSLTNITIPEGITSIGEYAFEGCSSLTSITIPEGVNSIGMDVFGDCSGLKQITIPASVTNVSPYAFSGCDALTDVYYGGTKEEWEELTRLDDSSLRLATIHFAETTTLLEIATQPENRSGNIGDVVAFTVVANGTGLSYRWQYSKSGTYWYDSSSEGSDTNSLAVEILAKRDGQMYRCVITDGNGNSVTSDVVTMNVVASQLEITSQPEDQSGNVGETVVFTVVANGEGLSYQWQYSKSGTYWYDSSSVGSDTNSMSVEILAKRDGQMYRCVITDVNGNTVTSDAATMTVTKNQLEITTQPENQSRNVGETVVFTVVANGEGLSYQWQYSKSGTYWYDSSSVGSDTNSMSVEILAKRDGQMYRCVITDGNGNSVTSDVATMNVAASQLEITSQPENQSGNIGDVVAFTVVAKGTDLSYQWQYSKSGTYWYDSGLDGSNTSTLNVGVTKGRDGQMYRCVITDVNGNTVTSEAATMSVSENKLEITSQPESQSGNIGEMVEFTVEVNGEGLSYQWQYSKSGTYWYDSSSTGSDTNSLSVEVLAKRDGQMYRCVITDVNGNAVTSDVAMLTVAK